MLLPSTLQKNDHPQYFSSTHKCTLCLLRGLVTEVPFVWNRGHGASLVGVLCNCRAWGTRVPAGQHHLVELLYFPGKSEGWALSQAKARSCLNYRSNLAELRICGVNVWNWTVKLCKGLWVVVTCAPMGHRAWGRCAWMSYGAQDILSARQSWQSSGAQLISVLPPFVHFTKKLNWASQTGKKHIRKQAKWAWLVKRC